MNRTRSSRALFLLLVVLISILLFPLAWELILQASDHIGASHAEIPPKYQHELFALGERAIRTGDVPVGAILLYGDSVIGSGFNTVSGAGEAGGHAEINAVSEALVHLGNARFATLNRDSLLLISTFEPCLMCKGCLLEYRIKRVKYLKAKPFFYRLKEDLRLLALSLRMSQRGPSALQDSLFRQYPNARRN
ncbi:MAG TPA: nucleoside deaminase [Bacteroidota bacterium]|nr:nucleoside deaminase [Bacteroidota bacterium]